ncbi:hypothetical protein G9A89_013072 [Geosiphon pyriformis]|nr:hypothetical protein G9A89_013072 [Geosiphon pyriformis]
MHPADLQAAVTNARDFELKQSLTNIPPATVIEDESLAAIFLFKIEELTETPLFSGAVLKKKPITVMYTDAKIDGQSIKLILDSGSAGSIITRQLMDQLTTKTPIGKIDNLPIEINGITVPIKVLVMEATQYQALNTQELQLSQNGQHTCVPAMCGHFKPIIMPSAPLIEFKEKKEKPTWEAYQMKNDQKESANWKWEETDKRKRKEKEEETTFTNNNQLCLVCGTILPDKGMWNDISGHGGTCNKMCQYTILINNWQKARPLNDPEEFYEHYQQLTPTRKKQEQCLEELNTQLCNHCLIPYDF